MLDIEMATINNPVVVDDEYLHLIIHPENSSSSYALGEFQNVLIKL